MGRGRAARGRTGCRRPGVDRRGAPADELGRFGLAQRRQAQRREPVIAVRAGERGGQRGGQLALARGEGEQQRRGGRPAHQRRQRVDRRRIGPLQIVHADDQRARGGKPFEQVAEGSVGLVPVAMLGLELALAVQSVGPQRVREIGLELRRARAEHRVAIRRRARRQVGEQPRLADPRLALHGHDPARARGQILQHGGDRLALAGPPDQRGRRGVVHGTESPTRPVR